MSLAEQGSKAQSAFRKLADAFRSATAPMRAFGQAMGGLNGLPDAIDLWCCRRYARETIRAMHPGLNVIDREDLLSREDRKILHAMRLVSARRSLSGSILLAGKATVDDMEDEEWRTRAESSQFFPEIIPDHVLVWEVMSS